ncbi:MAG TPA: iron-containing redox enzyme family protein [Pelomicrobium sp.]|nr:iron-containing redox enzyme family protein [Pelomicrobium sp.]
MAFYDELLSATERERGELTAVAFIRDGAAGALTLEAYVEFLSQAYHHVKHTLPLLMACGARLPERLEWLRSAMSEYIEEETGHQEWILNDIRACAGDAEQVRAAQPSLPAELMVAYAYDTIQRRNPVGFLGMVLVLEGTSVSVASQAAAALKKSLGLGDAAFTYLTSHGALDVGHTQLFASLVDRLDDAGDRAAVVHCAKVFYRLYGDIFRWLDQRRGERGELAAARRVAHPVSVSLKEAAG